MIAKPALPIWFGDYSLSQRRAMTDLRQKWRDLSALSNTSKKMGAFAMNDLRRKLCEGSCRT